MPADEPKTPLPQRPSLALDTFRQQPLEAGLTLDDLNAAFAAMLSVGNDPYAAAAPSAEPSAIAGAPSSSSAEPGPKASPDDACEVSPRRILEAVLFVGSADNQPIEAQRVARLMRGVRPAEIEELVRELNEQYAAQGCPYEIRNEGAGFRMALREEFGRVRDKFYGRVRQARLSAAAVEVLSIIAYGGPQTAEDVARQRGTPSGAILSQLVRRQLLAIERPESSPRRAHYRTTQRFLDLFGLASLDDLPRSQDLDRR
jgi:segregation and condensation protein B